MTATARIPAAGLLRRRARTALALARIATPYAAFAVLKRFVPAARLARWAWAPPRGEATERRAAAARALDALAALRRRRGHASGDCLEAALVRYRELSRAGADPELVMGFEGERGRVAGHAWVEVDGAPVGEDPVDVRRYVEAVRFGARGQRVG